MTNSNIKSLNYTEFQEFIYQLIQTKEIEIVKDWNIGRVLYKDSSMKELDNLNITQIRSRLTKKYNILVSKNDFKEVFEGVAEEITPKPDNIDEWISVVYDYLTSNNVTKIKLKDLASKVFGLSNKELNMSTQHRLGSILKTLNYKKNTKTKEWIIIKNGDTGDTKDTSDSNDDIPTTSGILKVSLLDRGDTVELQEQLDKALTKIADLESQLEEYKAKEINRFVPENRFILSKQF